MKSGITRRIDELGRIVVPKEIRFNLGIRDGEPLEIYTEDNSIIIKKYSQINNIKDVTENLCKIFSEIWNVDILMSDREKIIVSSSALDLLNQKLPKDLLNLIDNRLLLENVYNNFWNLSGYYSIVPVIINSNCLGIVIVINNKPLNENILIAKTINKIIEKKIDIF